MSKDEKVGRILPKPKPLMPNEDHMNESIMRQYNPVAAFPKIDEDDPDILAARDEVKQAEEKLRVVLARKTLLKLQQDGHHMNPENVEQLCEDERWKSGTLLDLSKDYFGFIPEKFEALAGMHDPDSEQYRQLMDARDHARAIYKQQIIQDVRKAVGRFNGPGVSARERRIGYEEVSTQVWHFYKRAGLEGNPVYKYQGARLLWSVEAALRRSYERNGLLTTGNGDGYQKWTIHAREPEEFKDVVNEDKRPEPPSQS